MHCTKVTGNFVCVAGLLIWHAQVQGGGQHENCTEKANCTTRLLCHPTINKCKAEMAQPCDGKYRDNCVTDTNCANDSVCNVTTRKDCTGASNAFCKNGKFCDQLGRCQVGVGQSCTTTAGNCIAGAKCVKSFCVCDSTFSMRVGAICEPKKGRIGSSCQVTGKACEVPNSVCEGGKCVCSSGLSSNHHFSCGALSESVLQPTDTLDLLGIFFGATATLVLLVLVVGFVITKNQKHKHRAHRKVQSERVLRLKAKQQQPKAPESKLSFVHETSGEHDMHLPIKATD